jgi:uncharacterized protein (UPF0335 family)
MMLNKKIKTHQRILKEVLKAAREKRGFSHEGLAEAVCLKKWHIKELEESEIFFDLLYYGLQVKRGKNSWPTPQPFRASVFICKRRNGLSNVLDYQSSPF